MANNQKNNDHGNHYILPNSTAIGVWIVLLILTVITVGVSQLDLGKMNLVVAVLVASVKAAMVALIFMNLRKDKAENAVIFATSFLFLMIFFGFTASDIYYRGDVYVKGPIIPSGFAQGAPAVSKFKSPWVATDALKAHGKEIFAAQCVACHGAEGKGDGAAAASLVPKPRNFTADANWKIGRKPSQIFKTLKEGIPGSAMSSFATLPAEDRWALAHFVNSLGPNPPKDSNQDLAAVGVDPTKADGGGSSQAVSIPVEVAMARLAVAAEGSTTGVKGELVDPSHPGAQTYFARCMNCHGSHGEGGIAVTVMGGNPAATVRTKAFAVSNAVKNFDSFEKIVVNGIQGNLMPGNGQLGAQQIRDLHNYLMTHLQRQ